MRNWTKSAQWSIGGIGLIPLADLALILETICDETLNTKNQTCDRPNGPSPDEGMKPFLWYHTNCVCKGHQIWHEKRTKKIKPMHTEPGWSLLPAFDPFCPVLFAHMNYGCGEVSWGKSYQQHRRFTACIKIHPPTPTHPMTISQWFGFTLAMCVFILMFPKCKYHKEMEKTYIGTTMYPLGLGISSISASDSLIDDLIRRIERKAIFYDSLWSFLPRDSCCPPFPQHIH